ncbi:hypothetical protein USDA257_c25340 [Sinorhizobium fredii USDA 257]|uniref:Uncharacterized protein n=1 Tax=Sinorhizobium fredii (strain USDA 257) TaxID=1185652 RepID=I3X5F4_SINF2|nr:hypothetical protein USDA257_c25340 [Sinorhizobium fredii USDA 257]
MVDAGPALMPTMTNSSKGVMGEIGPAEEVLSDPRSEQLQRFLAKVR